MTNEMIEDIPPIFAFTSYREYLSQCLSALRDKRSMSARAFARACAITSPNYFKQVIDEKRNLTPLIARRVADALALNTLQKEYLLLLVKLNHSTTILAKENALHSMRKIILQSERQVVDDNDHDLRSHWTTTVLWEMLKLNNFNYDAEAIRERLRYAATLEAIQASMHYWEARGFIEKDPKTGTIKASPLEFRPSNDVRRIDIQRSHLQFLQMAQHRLNDPLSEREFQGLIVAIKKEKFATLRDLCREFINRVNELCAADAEADEVIRVQLSAFKITKS